MRNNLVILGVIICLVGSAIWITNGAHIGWTKTTVAIEKIDEITGIPYREYEKKFVAGVEFPLIASAVGGVIVLIGLVVGRKK